METIASLLNHLKKAKSIVFLENSIHLSDDCEKLLHFMNLHEIPSNIINEVNQKSVEYVLNECKKHDFIIFQTTWLYESSRKLQAAFMSEQDISNKKTFLEIFLNYPTFDSKPSGLIHDVLILRTRPDQLEKWKFHQLEEDKCYWG